jgi:hypothetical protein
MDGGSTADQNKLPYASSVARLIGGHRGKPLDLVK